VAQEKTEVLVSGYRLLMLVAAGTALAPAITRG
jgi:hypothetical protein